MKLYYNQLSTYSQKVLLAFYEKGVDFDGQVIDIGNDEHWADLAAVYPIAKIPLLRVSEDHLIPESNIIIEYLEGHYVQGARLIPQDGDQARQVRFMDRMNDLYLNNSMITLYFSDNYTEAQQEKARQYLDISYRHLNDILANNTWLAGEDFTMADCSCIPPLFYLQKLYPYHEYPHLVAYFERARQRPSYQRVLENAMPVLAAMEAAEA